MGSSNWSSRSTLRLRFPRCHSHFPLWHFLYWTSYMGQYKCLGRLPLPSANRFYEFRWRDRDSCSCHLNWIMSLSCLPIAFASSAVARFLTRQFSSIYSSGSRDVNLSRVEHNINCRVLWLTKSIIRNSTYRPLYNVSTRTKGGSYPRPQYNMTCVILCNTAGWKLIKENGRQKRENDGK
jgi:hypothetical protein